MLWEKLKLWLAGVQAQLALYLLGFVLLITVVNLLVSGYVLQRYFAPGIDRMANERVDALATRVGESLRGRRTPLSEDAVREVLDGLDVTAVALHDADGDVLQELVGGETDERVAVPTWSALPGTTRFSVSRGEDGRVWRYFTPVYSEPPGAGRGAFGASRRPTAVLRVDVSLAPFEQLTRHNLLLHGAVLLVLVLAGVAVSIAAARRVTRPIRRLAEQARSASGATPSTPITPSGSIEVRLLGETINGALTSLRRSMARVRESEERYRRLFDAMPDIALELDETGRIVGVNAAVCLLGLRPRVVEGQPVTVLIAEEDRDSVLRALLRPPRASGLPEMNVRLRSAGGEPRFGELRAAPEYGDGGGQPQRIVAILRDVTARRRAEEQAAQAQRVLSVHTLAAGISHEFNNVMATILGMGSLLADRTDLPPGVTKELRRIVDTARRGADLARRLLAHTHRGAARQSSCDPAQVTEETLEILARTLDKRVELRAEYAARLPVVKCDPTELQQMLLNLGINAGDAMPKGGQLSFALSRVAIESHRDAQQRGVVPGDYVSVVVQDTGDGMDEATQRRIFEPYFTTKPAGLGTGLGLSGVYGSLTSLGGGITVDSAPGEGTRFELLLPASAEAWPAVLAALPRAVEVEVEAEETGTAGDVLPPTGTILVVDDEHDLLEVSEAILTRSDHEVLLASDGFAAEDHLRAHGEAIDLVLLDVNMPMRDGVQTFRALRALRPDLKVVVVSAGGLTDRRIAELLELGALDVLPKPYEYHELVAVVAKWLAAPALTAPPLGTRTRIG